MAKDKCLDQRTRAEDIILGALGFGEEAKIVSIKKAINGNAFSGVARWADGEQFEFHSDEELSEIEIWALNILLETNTSGKKAA